VAVRRADGQPPGRARHGTSTIQHLPFAVSPISARSGTPILARTPAMHQVRWWQLRPCRALSGKSCLRPEL